MTEKNIHLSVIVPVYNSAGFICRSLDAIDEFLKGLALSVELMLVDDGSEDSSCDVMGRWADAKREYPVRVIGLKQNLGKGAAVAKGMCEAAGKYRIFLDADLAYPPSQLLKILEALEDGADVAIACRVHEQSRYTISPAFFQYLYTRHLASRLINWFMKKTILPHCQDSQAGLKGFTARAAADIFSRQIIRGFSFDIEALFLSERFGFTIREVPVEFRYFSEPTTVTFLSDGIGLLRDVARIYFYHLQNGYRLPLHAAKKRLIINADDYGMSLPISRGILGTVKAGTVKSVSVMAGSPDFEASMDEILSTGLRPDVGFHATLTWGKPLCEPESVASLVDSGGNFLTKGRFIFRLFSRRIQKEHVKKELFAQCSRLAKRWPEISHMDGHHHVHIFPVIRDVAAELAREFGIKFIRSPREGCWSPVRKGFFRRLFVSAFNSSKPAYWRGRGFSSTDNFGGFTLGAGNNLMKKWIETVSILPEGQTEIMVHPGYTSDISDSYNSEREDEITALESPALVEAADDAAVEIVSFRTILNEKFDVGKKPNE